MPDFQRTVLWKDVNKVGTDHCTLWKNDDGWQLDGLAIGVQQKQPVLIQYRIQCNETWGTRYVLVSVTLGKGDRVLHLKVDDDQFWWSGKAEREQLRGCYDVDLGFTPATNMLPIRRLNMAVGESQTLTAAWVRFPELTVEPLPQRYTRLTDTHYLYENLKSDFTAEIDVDEVGFVINYPEIWQRVVQADG